MPGADSTKRSKTPSRPMQCSAPPKTSRKACGHSSSAAKQTGRACTPRCRRGTPKGLNCVSRKDSAFQDPFGFRPAVINIYPTLQRLAARQCHGVQGANKKAALWGLGIESFILVQLFQDTWVSR